MLEPRFVAKHGVLVQLWLSELAHQVGAEKDLAAHVHGSESVFQRFVP